MSITALKTSLMVLCGRQWFSPIMLCETGCTAAAAAAVVALVSTTELCPVLSWSLSLQLGSTAVSSCATGRHWALCSLQEQSCGSPNGLRVCTHTVVLFPQRLTACSLLQPASCPPPPPLSVSPRPYGKRKGAAGRGGTANQDVWKKILK